MHRAAVVCTVIALALGGCGASLRLVHDGTAYFERCYSADFDARVRTHDKLGCWRGWLAHYTEGQPPDKLEYARDRVEVLQQGDSLEPLPGLPRASLGPTYTTSVFTPAMPAETTQEPAAPTEASSSAPRAEPARAPLVRAAPHVMESACAPVCQQHWDECATNAQDRSAHIRACEMEFRTCMRACY